MSTFDNVDTRTMSYCPCQRNIHHGQRIRLFGLFNINLFELGLVWLALSVLTASCHLNSNFNNNPTSTNENEDKNKVLVRHDRQVNSFLEDEMCLANFDISEGSIIRTHDSQKLGAKYLNESDLGQGVKSREECLKLCCKTPKCNVNVFEEKVTKNFTILYCTICVMFINDLFRFSISLSKISL